MKPKKISNTDWNILKEKYPNNLSEIEKKISENYPVQYLIGDVEFYNTTVLVDERVLIPRFETEFLVEKTIKKITSLNVQNPKILDLGCGSGCIGIAIKKNINSEVTCVDISKEALELAEENAKINKVVINFKHEDMLNVNYENFDCIISNPPYVGEQEEVGEETKYEPQNAIFAKNHGLYFYEEIIKKVSLTKNKPKLIAFEIGYQQGNAITELARKYLSTFTCNVECDLSGKDRYVFLIKNE